MRRIAPLFALFVTFAACGLELSGTGSGVAPDGGALPDGAPAFLPDGAPIDSGTDIPPDAGADADAASPTTSLIYATSADKLWSFDPVTHVFTNIGVFPASCRNNSAVLDEIAVDSQGVVWGNARDQSAIFTISIAPYQCTKIVAAGQPFGLSFVKKGTVDPNVDALVGYKNDGYIRINPATGAVTTIAPAAIAPYVMSGDVAAEGTKAYVAVKGGPDCGLTDCLLEVSPANGVTVAKRAAYLEANVWGLAVSGGKVYAFANSGSVFEWTPGALAPTAIVPTPANEKWYGAGSTSAGN